MFSAPKNTEDQSLDRALKERNQNSVYGENIYDSFSGPSPITNSKSYMPAKNNI